MKRGFTLIELLAVIVILAIIALIAVPIVVNIINDSKTSSDEQSVELYLDTVKKTITKKQLSNSNFNPDKCKIQSNGDLDCYKTNNKIETLKVDIEGEHPEKGTIELKDNKFIYKNILLKGKYYYERGILVEDADNNSEISIGDKYTYKVNDTDTFNFYVLSFNDDSTVNLIMDRNICENGTVDYANDPNRKSCTYPWHTLFQNNSKGPVRILEVLYNATKNWTNIPDMDLSGEKAYIDEGHIINNNYGYGKIETVVNGIKITMMDGTEVTNSRNETPVIFYDENKPLKARLPRYNELIGTDTKCAQSNGSCEWWLVENMEYRNVSNDKYLVNKNNGITNTCGYWLLSSDSNYYTAAKSVDCSGRLGNTQTHGGGAGARPVVTVPITDLE